MEVSILQTDRRGEANQARKIAMYLVKHLYDLTSQKTAGHFGMERYWVVGLACAQVQAKQAVDSRFKKWVEPVVALFSQQKI